MRDPIERLRLERRLALIFMVVLIVAAVAAHFLWRTFTRDRASPQARMERGI